MQGTHSDRRCLEENPLAVSMTEEIFDAEGHLSVDLRPILVSLQDAETINNSNVEVLAEILRCWDTGHVNCPGDFLPVPCEYIHRVSANTKHVKAIIDTLKHVMGHLCEARLKTEREEGQEEGQSPKRRKPQG